MVKQQRVVKTSSRDWRREYQFPAFVMGGCYLPTTITTTVGSDSTGEPGYVISGELLTESGLLREENQDQWPEPPHLVYANLRTDDPQSAEAFVKRYGLLSGTGKSKLDEVDRIMVRDTPVRRQFRIDSSVLKLDQMFLRSAWEGDPVSIVRFEAQVEEGTAVDIHVNQRCVELRTEDLWTFISFLFLVDFRDEKLGICENPDCPARFFKKKRKTQKYCEAGSCVAHAQRQYSLDWWNRIGRNKRKKSQRKRSKS